MSFDSIPKDHIKVYANSLMRIKSENVQRDLNVWLTPEVLTNINKDL